MTELYLFDITFILIYISFLLRCRLEDIQSSGPSSLPLPTSHENSVQIERNNSEFQRITDESSYVPMSPRLKDITLVEMQAALQENDYVFMR